MIHASAKELRKAFNIHGSSSKKVEGTSQYLLLFYAVESGLKNAYLRENYLNSTEFIDREELHNHGHDITYWFSELKIPAQRITPIKNFHFLMKAETDQIKNIHEAWRYGILVDKEDEEQIAAFLQSLHSWIGENW